MNVTVSSWANTEYGKVQAVQGYIAALEELNIKPLAKDNYDNNVMGHALQMIKYLREWKQRYNKDESTPLSPLPLEVYVSHRGYPLPTVSERHYDSTLYSLIPALLDRIDYYDNQFIPTGDLPQLDNRTAFLIINSHLCFDHIVDTIDQCSPIDDTASIVLSGHPRAQAWDVYEITEGICQLRGSVKLQEYMDLSHIHTEDPDGTLEILKSTIGDEGTKTTAIIPFHTQLEYLLSTLTRDIWGADLKSSAYPRVISLPDEISIDLQLIEEIIHKSLCPTSGFHQYIVSRMIATLRDITAHMTRLSSSLAMWSYLDLNHWPVTSNARREDSSSYILDMAISKSPNRYALAIDVLGHFKQYVQDHGAGKVPAAARVTQHMLIWSTIAVVFNTLRSLHIETISDDICNRLHPVDIVPANFTRHNTCLMQYPTKSTSEILGERDYLYINNYMFGTSDPNDNTVIKEALLLVDGMLSSNIVYKRPYHLERNRMLIRKLQYVLLLPLYAEGGKNGYLLTDSQTDIHNHMRNKLYAIRMLLNELYLDPGIRNYIAAFPEDTKYRMENIHVTESRWIGYAGITNITTNRAISTCVYCDLNTITDHIPEGKYIHWLRDMRHISGLYSSILNSLTSSDSVTSMSETYHHDAEVISKLLARLKHGRCHLPCDGLSPMTLGSYTPYKIIRGCLETGIQVDESKYNYDYVGRLQCIADIIDADDVDESLITNIDKLKSEIVSVANDMLAHADTLPRHPFFNHDVHVKAMSEHGVVIQQLAADDSPVHLCDPAHSDTHRYLRHILMHLIAVTIAMNTHEHWVEVHYGDYPIYPDVPAIHRYGPDLQAMTYRSSGHDHLKYKDIEEILPLFNEIVNPSSDIIEGSIPIDKYFKRWSDRITDNMHSRDTGDGGIARGYLGNPYLMDLADLPPHTAWESIINECIDVIKVMDSNAMYGTGRYDVVGDDGKLTGKSMEYRFDDYRRYVTDTACNCLMFIMSDPTSLHTLNGNMVHNADFLKRYPVIHYLSMFIKNISDSWRANQRVPTTSYLE